MANSIISIVIYSYRVYLGGNIDYIEDPFNRKKELEKKEREEHHKKMQEKAFLNRVTAKETIATDLQTFGEDRPIP